MEFNIALAVLAVVIIIALAFYAGLLIRKIQTQTMLKQQLAAQQETHVAQQKQQRNDNICESIRFIAHATAQKQCNVSEAAIRLNVLLETLLIEKTIDIEAEYPALSSLFNKIKEMPTHDERKKVAIKKLKKLDMQRQVFESELEDSIIQEAVRLKSFSI